MKNYQVNYSDNSGYGSTVINSLHECDVEEAAELITEQLEQSGIEIEGLQIHTFEEITNPVSLVIANLKRYCP